MTKVDILLLEGASAAALGITVDALDAANRIAGRKLFDWRMLGTRASVAARGGVQARTEALARARARDLVVVPGLGAATPDEVASRMAAPDAVQAARWLARARAKGATIAASCTAVFLLGEAGLLNGRRCTTTWWLVNALAQRHPLARPSADSMVTDDGDVWTAGAALAHIDLMLALIARCAGPVLADEAARRLIVDQRASQARYVIPAHLAARDPLARQVEAYVRERIDRQVSLGSLADAVALSPRTFNRRLAAATGMPPMRFVQKIRLDSALHLLQTTKLSLEAVAEHVGFAEPTALYRLIVRHTGEPPSALRARKAQSASGRFSTALKTVGGTRSRASPA